MADLQSLGFPVAVRGEITKAARNWIGENLDAATRGKIVFMDRNDILNLYTVTNLPISEPDGDIEFQALPRPRRCWQRRAGPRG